MNNIKSSKEKFHLLVLFILLISVLKNYAICYIFTAKTENKINYILKKFEKINYLNCFLLKINS